MASHGHTGAVRRTVLVVLTWVMGTLLSVGLAWGAVSEVGSRVRERDVVVLSDTDVATQLHAASTTTTTTSPGSSAVTATDDDSESPAPGLGGGPSTGVDSPDDGSSSDASDPPSGQPTSPSSTETPTIVETEGGNLAVTCSGGLRVVWYVPASGYTYVQDELEQTHLHARFDKGASGPSIEVECRGSTPRVEIGDDD